MKYYLHYPSFSKRDHYSLSQRLFCVKSLEKQKKLNETHPCYICRSKFSIRGEYFCLKGLRNVNGRESEPESEWIWQKAKNSLQILQKSVLYTTPEPINIRISIYDIICNIKLNQNSNKSSREYITLPPLSHKHINLRNESLCRSIKFKIFTRRNKIKRQRKTRRMGILARVISELKSDKNNIYL